MAAKVLKDFQPEIVHVISPGDFSALGAYLGHRLGVPIVGSYHTDLHHYAATRARRSIAFLPSVLREPIASLAHKATLFGMTLFFKIPRLLLAPTPEICQWLGKATGRPCRIMGRGIDTKTFSPAWRGAGDGVIRLGYVGRLTIEKNVRFLARIEEALRAQGLTNYRFVIVGEGGERGWLAEHLQQADLRGVLRGEPLSRAYADFDLFVFPSHTDAFGNVVQEALASGVPAVVTADGGPKFVIEEGVTGFAAATDDEFIARVITLTQDAQLRQRMAAAARAATANKTWDDIMSTVYRNYRDLRESAAVALAGARADTVGRFPKKIDALGYGTPATKQQS
jgi:glycosyltransferase involved in cell wall biosynthesis